MKTHVTPSELNSERIQQLRVAMIVAVVLFFALSLFLPAAYFDASEASVWRGYAFLLSGWLGLLSDQHYVGWLANLLLIAAFILFCKRSYIPSSYLAGGSFFLSLDSLRIWISGLAPNEGGVVTHHLVAWGPGFYLWMGSIVVLFIASLMMREKISRLKLHIVLHENFEAPAAIARWAQKRGHSIGYTRLYQGDSFPQNRDGFDFLVIMGGPQSPATTLQECSHFDSKKEQQFIKTAIDQGKTLLGVCLGAQLIGEALGARFDHSPNREIGVFELELTKAGKQDPIIATFPSRFLVGHWHGDMPGLTSDAIVLATSVGCPRQIVRYNPRVYGFQCHFEFTPEAIEGMIQNCGHELEAGNDLPYVQSVQELRKHDYAKMNELLFRFLDYMVQLTPTQKPTPPQS